MFRFARKIHVTHATINISIGSLYRGGRLIVLRNGLLDDVNALLELKRAKSLVQKTRSFIRPQATACLPRMRLRRSIYARILNLSKTSNRLLVFAPRSSGPLKNCSTRHEPICLRETTARHGPVDKLWNIYWSAIPLMIRIAGRLVALRPSFPVAPKSDSGDKGYFIEGGPDDKAAVTRVSIPIFCPYCLYFNIV
ncbi:hypothetical protein PUN28_012010 [Cardiocondyla obscurior]|uniref:Uncharacterized protein n=1 Tax=Cardiocondyla obscurior TaxID=286306 RepID=A0AAW2FCA1_9HYME